MAYEYLKTAALPRHIAVALSLIGVAEIPGKDSNKIILGWAKDLGLDKIYTNDDMSWCALYLAYVMKQAGRQIIINTKDPYDYLRALKYQGANLNEVAKADAALGDILIFQRPEGGHVGFCVGEDSQCFHVLGGNQGNKVSIVPIKKERCIAVRRPAYISYQPVKYSVVGGGPVSTNEK